jgi:hypothetical protein
MNSDQTKNNIAVNMAMLAERGAVIRNQISHLKKQEELLDMQILELAQQYSRVQEE